MLALQVAAGIVLAYAIIVNQKKLLALGGWLVGVVATLAAFGALVWAATGAVQFAGAHISPKLWSSLLMLLEIIPVFILAATGAVGMLMLGCLLLGKKPGLAAAGLLSALEDENGTNNSRGGCVGLIGLGVTMLLINYLLSFPIWAFTPLGEWSDALYQYGMTNSWKDGLSLLFDALLWQWVWVPLGLHFAFRRFRARQPEYGNDA